MNALYGNYLLMDGVLFRDAIPWLYGIHHGDPFGAIEPLYLGTRWQGAHDLGPILVEIGRAHPVLEALDSSTKLLAGSCLLESKAAVDEVAGHLRQLLTVTDDYGSHSLFRFADPLVAHHWLASYSLAGLGRILGPLQRWSTPVLSPNWLPDKPWQWCHYQQEPTDSVAFDRPLNHLGDTQLAALDQAQRWRLKERLHAWLCERFPSVKFEGEQRGAWLDACCENVQAWGATSERSAAIWAECCLQWGDDFAWLQDGPFQNWQRDQIDLPVTPDQRLEAFSMYMETATHG